MEPLRARREAAAPELVHARLRLALEAAQMGLWDWDLGTGELVWDERSAEMYGTTLAESTGTIADVEQRVHPDDLGRVQAELGGAIESRGSVDVEFRTLWPDGSVHWVSGRGQALLDADGAVVRLIGTNTEVTAQRGETQRRVEDAHRMAGLVAVAQALAESRTEVEVLDVVSRLGTTVLGASGTVLCLAVPERPVVQVYFTSWYERAAGSDVAVLPDDMGLPMVHAATVGEAHFYEDRAGAVAEFPFAIGIMETVGTRASAQVPLRARGRLLGALSVSFPVDLRWRSADRELLEALAALTAQAVDRVQADRAEEEAVAAVRGLSESLQRSLLSDPPEPNVLQVAARYQPAASGAQVGGDWYDAFLTRGGVLTVVVGDVAGHDRDAAAAMAQARNVLRGVAQVVDGSPSVVLGALDAALAALQVDLLATAVLCTVERGTDSCLLLWSNAGHPPPLVIAADGTAGLLERDPDLLLGLEPATPRGCHELVLPPGATLVLYTDGLVERRSRPLTLGLARLVRAGEGLHRHTTEQVCDALLDELAQGAEDDVALLVLRSPSPPA